MRLPCSLAQALAGPGRSTIMINAFILSAALLAPRGDSVSRDSLIRELPAMIVFSVVFTPKDTFVNGLLLTRPPEDATLTRVQAALPFALVWLLQGVIYDRRQ